MNNTPIATKEVAVTIGSVVLEIYPSGTISVKSESPCYLTKPDLNHLLECISGWKTTSPLN